MNKIEGNQFFYIIGLLNKHAVKTADFDKSVINLPGYFPIAH
jgi:hypothetical protein